jgi:hypothetical protein
MKIGRRWGALLLQDNKLTEEFNAIVMPKHKKFE